MGFGRGGKNKNSRRSDRTLKRGKKAAETEDKTGNFRKQPTSFDSDEEGVEADDVGWKYQGVPTRKLEEMRNNVFSQFYTGKPSEDNAKNPEKCSDVEKELDAYKHSDAVTFAATSSFWTDIQHSDAPPLPRRILENIPTFSCHLAAVRAYYRVIVEKEDRYILMACHVNVHGFHRGDLRFVEVDDRTRALGSEAFSCVGNLIPGDVVVVTELARKSEEPFETLDVFSVNHTSKCIWAVRKMTVLTRKFREDLLFSFLQNGTAIAKGFDEALNVLEGSGEVDRLYIGDAFIPEKISCIFARNHPSVLENALVAISSKLTSYPNALATILKFQPATYETELFDIGVNAFAVDNSGEKFWLDDIVETCALMGYAAANTIFNGRFDDRTFVMMDARQDGQVVRFSITNPRERPTEGRWNCGTRIKFHGCDRSDDVDATIETVVSSPECRQLRIAARVSRDSNMFDFSKGLHVVKQRGSSDRLLINDGFFKKLDPDSNGRRIIETLYGGSPIELDRLPDPEEFEFPSEPPVALNESQNEYVAMLIAETPLVVVSSPFGCGKSMTIITAALEIYKRNARLSPLPAKQLLITQSNFAGVNLVDIARKVEKTEFPTLKFVRYVSEKNWKELPDNCRTEFDMPVLMADVFARWASGEMKGSTDAQVLDTKHMEDVVRWLICNHTIQPEEFFGEAKEIFERIGRKDKRDRLQKTCSSAFLALYQPDIIITTSDSLRGLSRLNVLKGKVCSVQIDEASQVPEFNLLSLLSEFPDANFGLIGDIQQLPPFSDPLLDGKLSDYGIGDTMRRALEKSMFPRAELREVYRCHPATTKLLSGMFYNGRLISGVTEEERNEFMRSYREIWPNKRFPIIIVDNQELGYKMGTSCGNKTEAIMVKQIVKHITAPRKGYCIRPEDVGVISFYSAQTSVLTEAMRGSGVKCGTVDAFQGSEREVVLVCCTNEKLSEFMQLSNRLNVAMSRARQATIVIGNLAGMRKAKFWSTIVKKAEEHGCLVDTTKAPFYVKNGENSGEVDKQPKRQLQIPGINKKLENVKIRGAGRKHGKGHRGHRRRRNSTSSEEDVKKAQKRQTRRRNGKRNH